MSDFLGAAAYRIGILGNVVSKTYPLVVETKDLFTVSGLCYITSVVGTVDVAITAANTVKLVANPTTGTSSDLCAATDIGTTDTPAGNLLAISGAPTGALVNGIGAVSNFPVSKVSSDFLGAASGIFISAGVIQQVTATGADGTITWYVTYVPMANGASIVAA